MTHTSDERRERYAAAMAAAAAVPWMIADQTTRSVYYEAADAAMAIADNELTGVHKALAEERDVAVRVEAENTRLRAELESARERWKAGLQRADKSVREMNAEMQRYATGEETPVMWSVYNQMHLRAANAEADIHQVRVLHRHNRDADYCDLCANHGDVDWPCATIRALDGEQQ